MDTFLGGWLPALLGLLVFGAMLVVLWRARSGVHRRLEDPRKRTAPRDSADRARDGRTAR